MSALQSLGGWAPFSPDAGGCLAASITDLASPSRVWEAGSHSLVQWGDEHSIIFTIDGLVALGDEPNAAAEDDMPAMTRIEAIARKLQLKTRQEKYRAVTQAVADLLAAHTDLVPAAAYLYVASLLDFRTSDALLAGLRDLSRLMDGRLLLARDLSTSVAGSGQPHLDGMADVARALAGGTVEEAILAMGIVSRRGPEEKWIEEWRDILRTLRGHPNADIRDWARRTRAAQKAS